MFKKKPVVKLEPLLPLVVRQYSKKCGEITDLHVKYEEAIRDIKKENMCLQVKNVYLKLFIKNIKKDCLLSKNTKFFKNPWRIY